MLCQRPFLRDKSGRVFRSDNPEDWRDALPLPCGQCLACRINKRRVWTLRNFLERQVHKDALFVTLTYAPEHLPPQGVLVKRDLQLYLKRLRKALHPLKVRYYACGEYGTSSNRPHYHLILYGVGDLHKEIVTRLWRYGFVHIGSATIDSIQYVAGYVAKKANSHSVAGVREFATMSRRPGIGATALPILVNLLKDKTFRRKIEELGDVPRQLRVQKKILPLGRYLIGKLREAFGISPETVRQHVDDYVAELQAEYLHEWMPTVDPVKRWSPYFWRDYLLTKYGQKFSNLLARNRAKNCFQRLTL